MSINENYLKKLFRPPNEIISDNNCIRLDRNEPPFSAFSIIEDFISNDELKSLNLYPAWHPIDLYT